MKLTKEEIINLSQEEVFFWADNFAKKEKEDQLRKLMLQQIEVDEANLIEG